MNCPEVRKIVYLFVDGALDPRANVDVLAHLNMCPPCNERFSDAKKFEDFLKERLRPQPAPPAVRARIDARLSEMTAPWPLRLAGGLRRRPLISMTGVAALLVFSFLGLRGFGSLTTCPYVRDTVKFTKDIQANRVEHLPPDGPGREEERKYPTPFVDGFASVKNGDYLTQVGPAFQTAVARAYRMDHCAEDKTCVVLYFISAPSLPFGEHNCVVIRGKKYCVWEHDGCRIVTWKNEKLGLYCMAVCQVTEMDHDALVNFANIASTQ
ncbi:MAG: anti-sigma factor [Planctomycetota bacterium]